MVRTTAYGVPAALAVLALGAAAAAASPAASPDVPDLPDPVDLGGSRVEVSTNPGAPTPLTAGLWADTLSGPGEPPGNAHWFRYERTMQYSSVLVGVVATSPEESGDMVALSVTAPDGTDCGSDQSSSGAPARGSAFGVLVPVPADEPGSRDDPCVAADHLDIRVTRGVADFPSDLPIAIRVVEEAPVGAPVDQLTPVVEEPVVLVPQPTSATPVSGATSFDDAPDLTSGQTVSDAVPEGAERLYRVHLDWGQALAARVDVPAQEDISPSPSIDLTLFDPLRNSFDGGAAEAATTGSHDSDGAILFDGTRPVTYLNRFDDELVSVPGDYWVSVAVAPASGDREPVEVPVEITVEVDGEPGDPPPFPGVVTAPGGSALVDGYDPGAPYLVDDGVFSADVSGTPRSRDEAGGDGRAADDDVRRTAGLVVGALSLASLLAGVVLLRRRAATR